MESALFVALFSSPFDPRRGVRRHRFMESSDIGAAFRHLFRPLRQNIRRGLTVQGQAYALEMDECIPGSLLGTNWLAADSLGAGEPGVGGCAGLFDVAGRRRAFARVLAGPGPASLIAWLDEAPGADGAPCLQVELTGADAVYLAAYPVVDGGAGYRRDLLRAPYRRVDPLTLA